MIKEDCNYSSTKERKLHISYDTKRVEHALHCSWQRVLNLFSVFLLSFRMFFKKCWKIKIFGSVERGQMKRMRFWKTINLFCLLWEESPHSRYQWMTWHPYSIATAEIVVIGEERQVSGSGKKRGIEELRSIGKSMSKKCVTELRTKERNRELGRLYHI